MSQLDDLHAEMGVPVLFEHMAGEIEHWPGGDRNQSQPVDAIVDFGQEQGENAGLLHKMTDDRGGRSAHLYVRIEFLAADSDRIHHGDKFKIVEARTGEVYIAQAVRRIGSDPGSKTWLATVPRSIDSKRTKVRP